jgi:hypothetical protein
VVPLAELEVRQDAARPVEEEPYGGAAGQLSHVGCLGWDGQRTDRALDLAAGGERLAAGGQKPQAGAGLEQLLGEQRAGLGEVLAVVEYEQDGAVTQVAKQLVLGGCRGHVPDFQRGQDSLRNLDRMSDTGEPHERDPVVEAVRGGPGGLHCEAGLPDAARAGDSDQPHGAQQLADPVQVGVAAEERCQSGRQPPPRLHR